MNQKDESSLSETFLKPIVQGPRTSKTRSGRGFSLPEIRDAALTLDKARRLGVIIDPRRRTKHPENVESLKKLAQEQEAPRIKPQMRERRPTKGRVFRGLTSSGRRMRGLRKLKGLKEVHAQKWKRVNEMR